MTNRLLAIGSVVTAGLAITQPRLNGAALLFALFTAPLLYRLWKDLDGTHRSPRDPEGHPRS